MNFGSDNFRVTFDVVSDHGSGGVVKVEGKNVSVYPVNGEVIRRPLSAVAIGLILSEGANYKVSATGIEVYCQ